MYTKTPLRKGSVFEALILISNHLGDVTLSTSMSSTERGDILVVLCIGRNRDFPGTRFPRYAHAGCRPKHRSVELFWCHMHTALKSRRACTVIGSRVRAVWPAVFRFSPLTTYSSCAWLWHGGPPNPVISVCISLMISRF